MFIINVSLNGDLNYLSVVDITAVSCSYRAYKAEQLSLLKKISLTGPGTLFVVSIHI